MSMVSGLLESRMSGFTLGAVIIALLTLLLFRRGSGPEVLKVFSCSTQLSMKIFLLIKVKMPIIVGILTFVSGKNSILGLSEPTKSLISRLFYTYEHLKIHA